MRVACSVVQSRLTLWDPVDCGPPGSSVHGILQAVILERLPFLSAGESPALQGGFFTTSATWEALTQCDFEPSLCRVRS